MRAFVISPSQTDRSSKVLNQYLRDIANIPLLTPEEEVALAQRIKEGDERALKRLVEANLRFVVSVAKQYQNQGLSLIDVINEGNIGLIKAAQRYDESRGFKFISYAVWWIRQSILQALNEKSRMIRLPSNKVLLNGKLGKEFIRLEQELGRTPTTRELADAMNLSESKVQAMIQTQLKTVSADAPFNNDEDAGSLTDTMPSTEDTNPDTGILQESLREEIDRVLGTLDKKESEIVKLFFGLGLKKGLTLEEIGERFALTRERVRQIKDRALRNLRKGARSRQLKAYLG